MAKVLVFLWLVWREGFALDRTLVPYGEYTLLSGLDAPAPLRSVYAT